MYGHRTDLMGKRFGKLTVIAPSEPGSYGQARWLCRCDCGNVTVAWASNLTSGNTKSCGCLRRRVDLTGQRFGRLTVLRRATDGETAIYSSPGSYWMCRCDCGNEVMAFLGNLRSSKTRSCGCLPRPNRVDMTGKRFGSWTVLREATEDEAKYYAAPSSTLWLCRCDCGTKRIVNGKALRIGRSKSCGCRSWRRKDAKYD